MSVLTGRKIEEIGHALFGPAWMALLAQHLGISKKTVRRWKDGKNNPPRDLRYSLVELMDNQLALLSKLRDDVDGRL